jgi:YHS domain-containing protein
MNKMVKDPVCHMEIPAASFATEYAGIHYAFCSAQCKKRFLANPHLYTGFPGHKAPAQQGKEIIKQRRMMLSAPLDAEQTALVKRALLEMMGVREIHIESDKIKIQYDLMQVTAEQIADKLALIGTELGSGWMDRLKQAFIHYQEECEVGSLEVENKKCH